MNLTKTDTFKDVMCGNVKYEYLHYVDVWERKMNTCTMLMCVNVKYEYLHYVDVWECKI